MKNTHWIYFLIKDNEVVYIGCSRNPNRRVSNHKYNKPHDFVRMMGPYNGAFAFKKETQLIQTFKPKHNKPVWVSKIRPRIERAERLARVQFGVNKSRIDGIGGIERARAVAKSAIEEEYNRLY